MDTGHSSRSVKQICVLPCQELSPGTIWSGLAAGIRPLRKLDDICAELLTFAPTIVEQFKAAEQRAEVRQKKWDEYEQKRALEEAERKRNEEVARRAKARRDSFEQLASLIESWSFACRMEDFFARARVRALLLPEEQRDQLSTRLLQAREMFGGTEPLTYFESWKGPEE